MCIRDSIDAEPELRRPRLLPCLRLPAGLPQDPPTDRDDQSRILRDANKLGGQQQPAGRVTPPKQRLDTRTTTSSQIYDGLVMQFELVTIDGIPQPGLKKLALVRTRVQLLSLIHI